MWLVFTKQEEIELNKRAELLLPNTGDRPAIFLNCILSKLREQWKGGSGLYATYVTTNPKIALTDAKPSQLRLAILFKRE